MLRLLAAMGCALLLTQAPARADPDPAFATAARMRRGVNVLGYDGLWTGASNAPFRMGDFDVIRRAGFDHVRINLFGFRFMDPALRLDATMLNQLDAVLDRAIAAGLVPVVDEHDYVACQADPAGCTVKLKAFWRQISARYAGRYPEAVFEILNEPGGGMTSDAWNALAAQVLAEIRLGNPGRTVVVAAINAEDPHAVSRLALPERDRNIIVTVHYYKPFLFTYQGAPWSPELAALHDIPWGTPDEVAQVEADLRIVDDWANAARRPVYLGEFGVFEGAPPDARVRWLQAVSRAAERRGWSWAYWQFDHDFALFDRGKDAWVKPVLDAVMR